MPSSVWNWFRKVPGRPDFAECTYKSTEDSEECKSVLSCKGGSTSGLMRHLKSHNIKPDSSAAQEYKATFQDQLKAKKKFSITTDEWSNMLTLQRFINVTVHTETDYFKLGLKVKESIKQTIKKARKIVIFFKQSSVRNGILQKFVKEYRGSKIELKVKKDVDTRWNSILSMCKRLVEIEQPIKMALSELGDNKYDENLFTKLKEIVSCLSPLEEAILEIGKSDSNLLKADSAIQYILTTLGKSEHEWSKELLSNLKIELQNRRNTDLVSLYKCLHTKSFDFLNNSSHELGYSSKKDIIFTAKRLYYQLFEYSNNSESVNDELGSAFLSPTEAEEKSSQCQSKSLSDFVQKEMSSSEQSSSQSNIKDEFKSMIATKVLTPKLELLYNALSTIQPSSTSCEEAFSVASLFATKLRNRSGPILLNALVFLKYYFLKKDGKQLKNRKQS
ncbi:hypothetical protein TYRP_012955 [Tyrophagus putrescentiae]|nr:hypothetical protein TYRP_012955 [Tyrophagus putrescentiae]